jgi:hypothetical protein
MAEAPESVADLPPMSDAQVRAMDKDLYYGLFGSMHKSLAPAVIEIDRMDRNRKIRDDWESSQLAAKAAAGAAVGAAAGTAAGAATGARGPMDASGFDLRQEPPSQSVTPQTLWQEATRTRMTRRVIFAQSSLSRKSCSCLS